MTQICVKVTFQRQAFFTSQTSLVLIFCVSGSRVSLQNNTTQTREAHEKPTTYTQFLQGSPLRGNYCVRQAESQTRPGKRGLHPTLKTKEANGKSNGTKLIKCLCEALYNKSLP